MFLFLLFLAAGDPGGGQTPALAPDAPELSETARQDVHARLEDSLRAIEKELSPPLATTFSVTVDAQGRVAKLQAVAGGARPPESWMSAFRRYEPYQTGSVTLQASVERTLLVPTTVTVQVEGANPHAAAVLFEAALAGISGCALPNESKHNIFELSTSLMVNADSEVADAQTVGGSPSLQACASGLARSQHLPPEYAGKTLRVDFSVDAGPPRVTLSLKEREQAGQLDPKEIKKVIQGARKAILDCHEQGLIRDPHLGGTIHVRFLVEKTGKVSSPSLDSTTMNDPEVETCVVGVVKGLIFPPPQGGVVIVDYPFVFRAAL